MNEIGSLLMVGAVVSVIVQLLKEFVPGVALRLVVVVILSLIAGSIYHFFKDTAYWATFISILGFAGAVYTYILKRFEDKPE